MIWFRDNWAKSVLIFRELVEFSIHLRTSKYSTMKSGTILKPKSMRLCSRTNWINKRLNIKRRNKCKGRLRLNSRLPTRNSSKYGKCNFKSTVFWRQISSTLKERNKGPSNRGASSWFISRKNYFQTYKSIATNMYRKGK